MDARDADDREVADRPAGDRVLVGRSPRLSAGAGWGALTSRRADLEVSGGRRCPGSPTVVWRGSSARWQRRADPGGLPAQGRPRDLGCCSATVTGPVVDLATLVEDEYR